MTSSAAPRRSRKGAGGARHLAGLALCLGVAVLGETSIRAVRAESGTAAGDALLNEIRHSFTLHGRPVPPLLFRNLGDGDLADARAVFDSADLVAAVASDLYATETRQLAGWTVQAG